MYVEVVNFCVHHWITVQIKNLRNAKTRLSTYYIRLALGKNDKKPASEHPPTSDSSNPALSPPSWTRGQYVCRGQGWLLAWYSSLLLDTQGRVFYVASSFWGWYIFPVQSFFAAILIVAGFVAIFAAQVYAIVLLVRWLFLRAKRPALFAGNRKSLLR